MWRSARSEARRDRLGRLTVSAAFLALAAFPALYAKVCSRFPGEGHDVLARTFGSRSVDVTGSG